MVVDASGRTSHAPQWLAAAGLSEPRKTTIGVDTTYSTANFRVPDWYDGESIVFITGPAPTLPVAATSSGLKTDHYWSA